ncbi:MAG TPA: ATP-binding protein [Chthoniobacteraceae bacterium]|jgi:PAS domain S-box-containing protein|nr:ATP-binding protein [Chthoniobacteraceae bacterium]
MPDSRSNPEPHREFLPLDVLWQAIVDSSDDAIISKNLEGIVETWNRGAERIFGYGKDEMIGQPIMRLLPTDRKDEEVRILERLRRGERVDHYETVRMCKDRKLIDVSLTISPIRNEHGVVVGASHIARDVSPQKRAQEELARAHEALKRADRLKTEFISTLSHELRTPLAAITGWIQILEEKPTAEEAAEGLQIIKRNVRVQSQLIEDLLDISRIEAGKLTLDIQRIDLAAAVSGAIEALRPTADAKGIRLTSAFSSVEGIVMGDKARLQQVVWNLLSNAVKFTPKGGRIHVTLERINSHVEVTVADNGLGIAPEHIDQIFDRFTQIDGSTTRRFGGLGLGLSIVKHLVELHGGSVRALSQGVGHGAKFVVGLPLLTLHPEPTQMAAAQRAQAVGESTAEPKIAGIRILAVDDDVDSVMALRRMLERRGAEVRIAGSMDEALQAFVEFKPDVLLSDIGMPDHDGYELIGRVRVLPGGRSVAAVALTALARPEDRTRALRAGFQMHVAKPVEATELVALVRNLTALARGE